jgi:hypothetical protein
MTGLLTLSGDPTAALNPTTKQYVDGKGLGSLSDVAISVPTSGNTLIYNGTDWVNSPALTNLQTAYNNLIAAFPYDITFSFSGILLSGKMLGGNVFVRALSLPAGLTGSAGITNAPTVSTTVLNIYHNGTVVGAVTFATGASTATFTLASPLSLAIGDKLELQSDPTNFDGNLTNIYVTFKATGSLT